MSISRNLDELSRQIPDRVKLVAVSKNQPAERIREAYSVGQRRFGENKVQDLLAKHPLLPADIEWHFIGHLQTNKVRDIIPFVALIQSVDSLKLLIEINKEAKKIVRVIDCLLEMHIAKEETKFGLTLLQAKQLLESPEYSTLHHIRICGVMGMATFTTDESVVSHEFRTLQQFHNELKNDYFADKPAFAEISMGMSDDFLLAIREGSTIVRIGTAIFGERMVP
jgi:PLP dependent protein